MNERIRELAFQAMSINQKVSDDSFYVEVSKLKEFEKFAELIAAECINMIEAEADKLDAVWWSEQAEENAVHGMRNAAGLISRAFITFK